MTCKFEIIKRKNIMNTKFTCIMHRYFETQFISKKSLVNKMQ